MALEQWGKGSCINCGFLGKRDQRATYSMCYEASATERLGGWLTQQVGGIATRPWCFVDKVRFYEELQAMGAQEHQVDKVQELLKKARACPSWYPWREFLSPKEHFEVKLQERNERERKRTNWVMIGLTIALLIFSIVQVFAILRAC